MPRYLIPVQLRLDLPNDFTAKIVRGLIVTSVAKMMAEGLQDQPATKDAAIEVAVGEPEQILK